MSPRVAVVGGGPGGLFLATLVRRHLPTSEVTLFERNQASDAFGFGVVFSDATLRKIHDADPVLRDGLNTHGRHWDRIEVWSAGERHSFSGNGMAAIHRRILLRLLQENAADAGVELKFGEVAPPVQQLSEDYDLVVGADGTNSVVREHLGDIGHTVETANAKFIWFGTTHLFDGLTFVHRVSEHGNFAVHGYPISDDLSTFIVETDEETWRRAGMDEFDVSQPPGPSDTRTQEYFEKLFAEDIGGGSLVANNSRWGNFRTRRTQRWYRDNVAILGDAVHTAHFSVGSGTKMAMEDAVSLAEQIQRVWGEGAELESALADYQEERAASVAKIQNAARPSLAWWERFGTYQREMDALTFTFHFFSRSIGISKIAQRDPDLAQRVRDAWEEREGAAALDSYLTVTQGEHAGLRLGRLLHAGGEPSYENAPADGPASISLVDTDGTTVTVPLITAPEREAALDEVAQTLPRDGLVAISGPDPTMTALLSEEARLHHGLTAVLVGDYDDDDAETLLLSGRADAVALDSGASPTSALGTGDVR